MKYLAIAFSLLFAMIAMVFIPAVVTSSHETITNEYTDTGNITTGVGETSGNMTLTEDLYLDRLASILTLTSTHGADNPVATSYNSTTNILIVGGLIASQTRLITCTYEYNSSDEFPNSTQVMQMVPTMVVLALLALIVGIPMGLFAIAWRKAKGP